MMTGRNTHTHTRPLFLFSPPLFSEEFKNQTSQPVTCQQNSRQMTAGNLRKRKTRTQQRRREREKEKALGPDKMGGTKRERRKENLEKKKRLGLLFASEIFQLEAIGRQRKLQKILLRR